MVITTLQKTEDIVKNHLPSASVYAFCKVIFEPITSRPSVHFVHDPGGKSLVQPNRNPRIHLTISGAKTLITENISNYCYDRLAIRIYNMYDGSKISNEYSENDHFICLNNLDKSDVFLVNLSDRSIVLYVKDYAIESSKNIQKKLRKTSKKSKNFHTISSLEDILMDKPKPKDMILPSSWDDIFAGK